MTTASQSKRALRALAILTAGLLVLTSCVSMEIESEFDEDGGATHSMALTIDMSELEQLGDLGEIDPFENFENAEEEASEEGFRVERIEDGDIVGVRLIQEVDDSSDLGEQLNALFNAGAAEGENASPFSGTFEKDGNDYRLDLTVDGTQLSQSAGEELDDTDELGIGLDTLFDFNYTARLPGEIDEDETNGTVSEDGVVSWDLPLEGVETLTAASSSDSDSSNIVLMLVVVGIIVLGLIALAAVAYFILMNRRGATPAAAPPDSETAASETPPPPAEGSVDPDQPTEPLTPDDSDTPEPRRRDEDPDA